NIETNSFSDSHFYNECASALHWRESVIPALIGFGVLAGCVVVAINVAFAVIVRRTTADASRPDSYIADDLASLYSVRHVRREQLARIVAWSRVVFGAAVAQAVLCVASLYPIYAATSAMTSYGLFLAVFFQ